MKRLLSRYRVRNTVVAGGLAFVGALLVFAYVVSYRDSVESGANLVEVFVAAKDIPAGLDGASAAGGGYLEKQTVLRRNVIGGAISSSNQIADLAAAGTILAGEQITVRQFHPLAEQGVLASINGNLRAMTIPGDSHQVLAGIAEDGDRVDVIANIPYSVRPPSETSTARDANRVAARVILRNLLVLRASGSRGSGALDTSERDSSITLALTDAQAQKLLFAVQNGEWWLILRPVAQPNDSPESVETMESILADGLDRRQVDELTGGFGTGSISSD